MCRGAYLCFKILSLSINSQAAAAQMKQPDAMPWLALPSSPARTHLLPRLGGRLLPPCRQLQTPNEQRLPVHPLALAPSDPQNEPVCNEPVLPVLLTPKIVTGSRTTLDDFRPHRQEQKVCTGGRWKSGKGWVEAAPPPISFRCL